MSQPKKIDKDGDKKFSGVNHQRAKGSSIPFTSTYNDPLWRHPAYHPNWHSSNYRWSYIPLNAAYQQHSIFIYQGGASWCYDLSNMLALPDGAWNPSPINHDAFSVKYSYVARLIMFTAKPVSLKHYKNQIAVGVQKQRTGLYIIDFDYKELQNQQFLVQMSTMNGSELDYVISSF